MNPEGGCGKRNGPPVRKLHVPYTLRIGKDEREALTRLLEAVPDRWLKAADFIHEAIREKLHRERQRYRGP